DEKVSLVTLLLHPAFVFLFVPYTESLYLLLLFLLMLSWQKKSSIGFLLLSLWIGLCRPTGLFLMPAAFFTLLILFYREVRSHWGETRSLSKLAATLGTNDALITHVKLLVLGIAGSLTALLTVAVVMKISVDDWFAFYRYRNLWKEVRGIGNFLPFVQLDFGMHTGRVLVVWLSIWGCWLLLKSGRIFEAVFCVLSLLLPIYQGKMGDIVRYALGAAPAWMFLTAERQAGRRRLLFVTAISVGIGMQLLEKWIQRTWVG
ncbi:MAG: Mannosyltransferase, partial [Pseudomonadota bacterium]